MRATKTIKGIKVNIRDEEKLARVVEERQQGVEQRTLTPAQIVNGAIYAEEKLKIVPKKYWKSAEVHIDPYRVPNSYKYPGQTSMAVLKRGTRDWFLTFIGRVPVKRVSYGSGNMPPTVFLRSGDDADAKDILRAILAHNDITLW